MLGKFTLAFAMLIAFSGCSSVPMEDQKLNDEAKRFSPPSRGSSGLYIYRDSMFGAALKKDIWVNGKCIGETAPKVFFYEEVPGEQNHKISTESEFSPNDLNLFTKMGINYFIRQYIKMGVLVGGAGLELVDSAKGKNDIKELGLAKKGRCSS